MTNYLPTIGIDYGVKTVEVNTGLLAQCIEKEEELTKKKKVPDSKSSSIAGVRVNFWDVSGCENSLEIRNEFYGPAQGILLMFDVRNEESFAALDNWWQEVGLYVPLKEGDVPTEGNRSSTTANTPAGKAVGDNGGRPPVVILCANKVDSESPGHSKREVSTEEGKNWAETHNCMYFETSCTSSHKVSEPMMTLIHRVIARFLV